MNLELSKKTLLVIDDATAFCERITAVGQDKGWMVFATGELEAIRDWLANRRPDVVLLDWQLKHPRNKYLELLVAQGLASRTLLLSNALDEARERFIEIHGLAGARIKPLDMEHFEDAVALPKKDTEAGAPALFSLDEAVNQLPPAVDILDAQLTPLWSNQAAKLEPLNAEQWLIVRWLKAELVDGEQHAARRLDWDGSKKVFLESRLFRLDDGRYWLARDWRTRDDRPHDHELLNLEGKPKREDWSKAVAKLLAQRYAISRFRVYKVAPLPHTEGLETEHSPLIMPLSQSGGGFLTDENTWRNTGFKAEDNPNTREAFASGYVPKPLLARDARRPGCENIGYGEGGTHRVQFPVRHEGRIAALFSFDRRLDHAESLTGFDREVVDIARRMASDASQLTQSQWSLMQGLAEDLGRRLHKWLHDGEEERHRKWHDKISAALKDTFADAERSPEMTYDGLSLVCKRLCAAWQRNDISGHVMGTSPWRSGSSEPTILSWHIVLKSDEKHWQAVAGWGAIYDACRQFGGHALGPPHSHAFGAAWEAVVIQDYQAWRRRTTDCCGCVNDGQCRVTGSWLAVPMKVAGDVRAMMVVHSPHAFYFTTFRTKLLENAAKRLLPLLAAALREVRSRSAFAAAVMHEVKNDAHGALMVLDGVQAKAIDQPWAAPLAEVRHHLEGLDMLGQDTLEIFRLGLSEHDRTRQTDDKELSFVVRDLLAGTLRGWEILYDDTVVQMEVPADLARQTIKVSRALAFKRVMRVLLHNAFRHGFDWVKISVALKGGTQDGRQLEMTITNPAYNDVAAALAENVDLAGRALSASPLVRGRLGLAVARQLALDAGGCISELCLAPAEDNQTEAKVTLIWPIRLMDDTSEAAP
jgi:hypothetical protein